MNALNRQHIAPTSHLVRTRIFPYNNENRFVWSALFGDFNISQTFAAFKPCFKLFDISIGYTRNSVCLEVLDYRSSLFPYQGKYFSFKIYDVGIHYKRIRQKHMLCLKEALLMTEIKK